MANEFVCYDYNLLTESGKQIKPSEHFDSATSKNAAHIYVMCDHTFASYGYDIGETNKVYKNTCGVSALPYHYVIKHVDSEVQRNGNTEILPAGTVFQTRSLNKTNECNNSNMIGGKNAIAICLTTPAGSWISNGYNAETAASLNLLLRYLIGELGLNIDYIHNLKNEYIGDYPVNPDSWNSFIAQMKEDMREASEKFSSSDDESTVLTIPESLGTNSNLDWIAKLCCPNASSSELAEFKSAVAEVNPDVWPGYKSASASEKKKLDSKYIPFGTKVYLPSESVAAEVKERLAAQGMLTKIEDNTVLSNTVALKSESYEEQILREWNDPADVHREGDDSIYLQNRGGKSEMKWRYQQMELPGYHNALLHFTKRNSDEEPIMLNFLISPSSVQENRSTIVNSTKTLGGWVGVRAGQSIINVRFSGYMLDIYDQLERHRFLRDYKNYIESRKDSSHSYYNDYNCKLIIEGRDYYGVVSSLSFSKDGERPYVYQYNIGFTAYSDKEIYDPSWALVPWYSTKRNKGNSSSTNIGEINDGNIYEQLIRLMEEGWAGDENSAAYKYLKSIVDSHTMGDIDAVREETEEWVRVLNYIKSRNNSWSHYLRQLIDSSIISNLDIWGFENSEPDMPSTVALFDKICSDVSQTVKVPTKTSNTNAKNHWSQPNAVSLYAKGVIKQKDEWFNSDWTIKYANDLTSRGMFLALCDNIGGSCDYCLDTQYGISKSDILKELESASALDNLNYHWAYRHVWSLYKKGAISEPIDEYWLENCEATITSEYAIPLICKSKEASGARVFPDYASKNWSTSSSDIKTAEAICMFVKKTVGSPINTSGEANQYIADYQPYLVSLHDQGVIREWPNSSTTWATRNANGDIVPSFNRSAYLSRAKFLGLCDNIGGTGYGMDPVVSKMSSNEVMSELSKHIIENGFRMPSYHPAFKNVLSLYRKGALGSGVSSYWVEDVESTVQSDYAYTIIAQSLEHKGEKIS